MRRFLFGFGLAVSLTALAAGPASAAPPGLPDDNPNSKSVIITVVCPGYNGDQPFQIWMPNATGWQAGRAAPVGHPIDVDVPLAVEKPARTGAYDRTIPCLTQFGGVAPVMPTGKP